SGTASSTPRGSRGAPHDVAYSARTRPARDHRDRDPLHRADPGRPPALAAHGDHERISGRRFRDCHACRAGEPGVPRPQRGAPPGPLRTRPVRPSQPAASPRQGRTGARRPIGSRVAALPPAAFSIVMATGIVSIAANLTGLTAVAWFLLALNIPAYLL